LKTVRFTSTRRTLCA